MNRRQFTRRKHPAYRTSADKRSAFPSLPEKNFRFRQFAVLFAALAVFGLAAKGQIYELSLLAAVNPDGRAEIHCLYQDSTGFLWIGTDQGLWRYDGQRTEFIPIAGDKPLPVTSIARIGDTLFAGTSSGAVLYTKKEDGKLHYMPSEEGYTSKPITALCADSRGRLWMGTSGEGLYLRQANRWYLTDSRDGLPSGQINALVSDGQGGILAGTDRGLVHLQQEGSDRKLQVISRGGQTADPMVTALLPVGSGRFLVGFFSGGIATFSIGDLQTNEIGSPEQWPFGTVSRLAAATGRWWIGTEEHGLLEADPQNQTITAVRFSGLEPVQRVRLLLGLREGNVLSASREGQLFCFDPRRCAVLERGMAYGETQAVLETREGWLWFSTLKGLYRMQPDVNGEPERVRLAGLPESAVVVALHETQDGSIWLGTFDRGAYRIAPGSAIAVPVQAGEDRMDGSVLAIRELEGIIWLATLGGIYAVLPTGRRAVFLDLGIGQNFVFALFPDPEGGMWIGTDGTGLYFLPPDSLFKQQGKTTKTPEDLLRSLQDPSLRARQYLSGETVYNVLRDAHGLLWIQTRENGLFAGREPANGQDPGFQPVNLQGSPEEVMSIALDGKGELVMIHERSVHWISTPHKISRPVDLQELRDRPRPMSSAVFSRGHRIWFGTNGGPYRLQGTAQDLLVSPVATLASILASGEAIKSGSRISGGRRHLEFLFNAPWIGPGDPVLFEYRLQGLEQGEWRSTMDERVSYANLPSGDYRFELRSMLKESPEPGPVTTFSFSIPRPLYARPWFIASSVLGLFLIVLLWVRSREKRLRQLQEVEKNKIRTQFELLRNQVNPHFLFNSFNTLSGLIEEDPQRAQTYVDRLAGFFRNILAYRHEELILLRDELRILEDYLSIQRARYEENLKVSIRVPDDLMEKALPPMTLQILVENALKHNVIARNHPMNLRIEAGEQGRIRVANDLRSRNRPAEGTGLGLENLSRKLQLLGAGGLQITATDTEFVVEVPLLNLPIRNATDASTHH